MPARATTLIGVPIKPFGVAKQRLHPRLSRAARSVLGRSIAAHTLQTIASAGGNATVVTGDPGVRNWATDLGFPVQDEAAAEPGLNGAARALQHSALTAGRPWLIVHADLPLVNQGDVAQLLERLDGGGAVIAPSHDGGTSALGAGGWVQPSYGPGSYHRHLRALRRFAAPATVCRPGLAFDLDTVADLDMLLAVDGASWIKDHLEAIDSVP